MSDEPKPFSFEEAIKSACRSGPERTLIYGIVGELKVLTARVAKLESQCSACPGKEAAKPAPKTTKKTPTKKKLASLPPSVGLEIHPLK